MSKIENNTLRDILRSAGLDTFQNRRSDPKARAQDALSGRTHYVDDSTLRYFHSRIVSSGCICSDTLFYIVESCALDPNNSRRGFRGVVFDVWGTAVYRPSMEESHKNSEAARRAMYAWLDQFDVAARGAGWRGRSMNTRHCFVHPSMPDAELLRITSLMETHHVVLLNRRLQDRVATAAWVRSQLDQLPGLIDAGKLPQAIELIDKARGLLDWTHAPGYGPND